MHGEIIARFIGDPEDSRTKIMGIKLGKKYPINIKKPGIFHRVCFKKVELIAEIITKRGTFGIPYESRYAFFNNWKIKRI